MIVVGGLIVGSPGDTRESVEANLEFARRYVDWPYIQHPTPYPGTPMTKDFRDRGLIINERLEEYDGTRRPPRRALGNDPGASPLGRFINHLLVGNFSFLNSGINAFDPTTGKFRGRSRSMSARVTRGRTLDPRVRGRRQ